MRALILVVAVLPADEGGAEDGGEHVYLTSGCAWGKQRVWLDEGHSDGQCKTGLVENLPAEGDLDSLGGGGGGCDPIGVLEAPVAHRECLNGNCVES